MTNILVLSCNSVLIQLLNTLAPTSASRADKGSSNRKISASSYTALLWDREDGFVGDVRRCSEKVLVVIKGKMLGIQKHVGNTKRRKL